MRLGFPKIITNILVTVPLSRRAGSLLHGNPTQGRVNHQLLTGIFWAGEDGRRSGVGWQTLGFETPNVAHSSRAAAATPGQFGGKSGPTLQEFLARKLTVQLTAAFICLSKFHLAGGEQEFARQSFPFKALRTSLSPFNLHLCSPLQPYFFCWTLSQGPGHSHLGSPGAALTPPEIDGVGWGRMCGGKREPKKQGQIWAPAWRSTAGRQ